MAPAAHAEVEVRGRGRRARPSSNPRPPQDVGDRGRRRRGARAHRRSASTYTPLFARQDGPRRGCRPSHARRQVRKIAKVESGVNVIRLDSGRAERRLERNAWVGRRRRSRRPSRPASRSSIAERTPAAVVARRRTALVELLAGDGTDARLAVGRSERIARRGRAGRAGCAERRPADARGRGRRVPAAGDRAQRGDDPRGRRGGGP